MCSPVGRAWPVERAGACRPRWRSLLNSPLQSLSSPHTFTSRSLSSPLSSPLLNSASLASPLLFFLSRLHHLSSLLLRSPNSPHRSNRPSLEIAQVPGSHVSPLSSPLLPSISHLSSPHRQSSALHRCPALSLRHSRHQSLSSPLSLLSSPHRQSSGLHRCPAPATDSRPAMS